MMIKARHSRTPIFWTSLMVQSLDAPWTMPNKGSKNKRNNNSHYSTIIGIYAWINMIHLLRWIHRAVALIQRDLLKWTLINWYQTHRQSPTLIKWINHHMIMGRSVRRMVIGPMVGLIWLVWFRTTKDHDNLCQTLTRTIQIDHAYRIHRAISNRLMNM